MRATGFVILFALAGCATTPATQVAMFGKSATEVSGKVDAVMEEYSRASLERQFTGYAATYNGSHAYLLTSDSLSAIAEPVTPEQKKNYAIYKANRALGAYSTALAEFASAGSREQTELAAARLFGSIASLNDQYTILKEGSTELFDKEKVAGIASLITAIGGTIVERKRREAIRGIVIQADPAISLVCDAIISQLDQAGIEESIAASRQAVLSEEIFDYKTRASTTSTSLNWRREQIRRLYGLQQGVFHSKLMVQQTRKAIIELKSAHAVLAKELARNRFSSREITESIRRLVDQKNHYDDFRTLLLDCRKISRNQQGVLSCDDK